MQTLSQGIHPGEHDAAKTRQPADIGRMGDAILQAFERACQQDDLEAVAQLLMEYEGLVTRLPVALTDERRCEFDNLIAAHNRFWEILRDTTFDQ